MKMISTLTGLSELECRLLNKCCLPDPSKTGRSAARPRSSFEGSLLDTSMSPVKFPVGPSGLEGAVEAILITIGRYMAGCKETLFLLSDEKVSRAVLEYKIKLLC